MAHSVPQSVLSGFSFRKVQINLLIPWFLLLFGLVAPTYGRVAGKVGHSNHYYNGRSYVGMNEDIMWVSIGMGITILVLICIALCYIAHEKCQKRREFYVNA